ncbi:hypothetical protein GPJ56_003740 [Histomonas meleagridis]|uniref:uncharacterized protein n=1 Tax=Histomonas meleagridis TaxID=135588 RepID=UPI00355A5C12|nr:hypothetical protein GPJ56_003740 [Histomonas meleagridis]KAH0805198.1 hypothetical protein GO595_002143 [Histomonas meleagridis]
MINSLLFDDENKYSQLKYGVNNSIHHIAVCIAVFSLAAFIFTVIAILLFVAESQRYMLTIFMIISMLTSLGLILTQIIGLSRTTYGNAIVTSQYNYYDTDDTFRDYVDTYFEVGNATLELPPNNSTLQVNSSLFVDFYITYKYYQNSSYHTGTVPSCNFTFPNTSIFNSSNPCDYDFSGVIGNCIGFWNPTRFQSYWCTVSNEQSTLNASLTDYSLVEDIAKENRKKTGIASYSVFYGLNVMLLSIECITYFFIIVLILLSLFLENNSNVPKTNPKNKKNVNNNNNKEKEEKKKEEPKKEEKIEVKNNKDKEKEKEDTTSDDDEDSVQKESSSTIGLYEEEEEEEEEVYEVEEEIEEEIEEETSEESSESSSSSSSSNE